VLEHSYSQPAGSFHSSVASFCVERQNTKAEDAVQVVRALAVHRVCGHPVRIIVEVLDPTTQTSAVWDETQSGRIEIICPAKLHYKMLSRRYLSMIVSEWKASLFSSKLLNIQF
jgi:hypothetical protein